MPVVEVSTGPLVAVVEGFVGAGFGVEVVVADGIVLALVACKNVELVFDSS